MSFLEDRDNILRVEWPTGLIQPAPLIDLLKDLGVEAEVLPDNDSSGVAIPQLRRIGNVGS